MANWHYYNKNGEKVGPVTPTALKLLAQQGVISRETVLENQNGRTAVAGDVNGLTFPTQLDATPKTTVTPPSSDDVYGLSSQESRITPYTKPELLPPPFPVAVNPFTIEVPVAGKPDTINPFSVEPSVSVTPPAVASPAKKKPFSVQDSPVASEAAATNPFTVTTPIPKANQAVTQKESTPAAVYWLLLFLVPLFSLLIVGIIANSGGSFTATERKEIDEFIGFYGNDVRKKRGRQEHTLLHIAMNDLEEAITDGRPPRHWGLAVVRYLVSKGADVNAKTSYGYTPLHFAGHDIEIVKFLVSKGANIRAKSDGGSTVLHHACAGDVEAVKFLVSKGADVHATSEGGYTPLHQTAELNRGSQSPLIASFLISKGADVNAKDENGRTPLAVAREYNNWALIEYLTGLSKVSNSMDNSKVTRNIAEQAEIENFNEKPLSFIVLEHTGHHVLSAAFSPDGKKVVTTGLMNKVARIWDADSGRELRKLEHTEYVLFANFSPDGKKIVTKDTTVRIWDADSGRELRKLEHTVSVGSVGFSPDGKRIVTASDDQTARIWDTDSGKELQKFVGHTGSVGSVTFSPVGSVGFSPDGKRIVTASDDQTARIWDTDSGKELQKLEGHIERVFTAAFSPDGKKIVTASRDKTARIWDADLGKELKKLEAGNFVSFAVFSPNGKKIVTCTPTTTQIWDADSGKELKEWNERAGNVQSAILSPDGKKIVTCVFLTPRIWDTDSGKELKKLEGHTSFIKSAAFSPDGKKIVTASDDQTARIWTLE